MLSNLVRILSHFNGYTHSPLANFTDEEGEVPPVDKTVKNLKKSKELREQDSKDKIPTGW